MKFLHICLFRQLEKLIKQNNFFLLLFFEILLLILKVFDLLRNYKIKQK